MVCSEGALTGTTQLRCGAERMARGGGMPIPHYAWNVLRCITDAFPRVNQTFTTLNIMLKQEGKSSELHE
jgi:hypothetical protein